MEGLPDKGDILEKLLSHSDKHFGRVDTYFQDIQKLLLTTPEWKSQHEVIFKEMMKSVRTSRRQGIAATVCAVFFILLLIAYVWFVVPYQQRQLVDDLRTANLEIEFQESGSDLLVKYVTDEEDSENKSSKRNTFLKEANLYNVVIGRYPGGLGPQAVLRFRKPFHTEGSGNASDWRWNVTPQSDNFVIGTLDVANIAGFIDLDQVYFHEPVAHTNLPELMLKIVSVTPDRWIERVSERSAQYQVTFGVRPDGYTDLIWADSVHIRYSGSGHIKQGPFWFSVPEWSNAYIANIGIGYWGIGERRIAYFAKSDAYRVSFNATQTTP